MTGERKVLLPLVTVALFLGGVAFWARMTGNYRDTGSDFMQDYLSARLLLQGESIYGSGITEAAGRMLGAGGIENFHPPSSALFFTPLALLPYGPAFWLWSAISLLLYLVIVGTVCRNLSMGAEKTRVLQALLLFWYPFLSGIALGQSSMVIAFCIISCWAFMHKGREVPAGVMAGLASLLKLYPLFLLGLFLARKSWKALLSSLGVVLAGAAATLAIVGPADVVTYILEVAPRDAREWGLFPLNISLAGFFSPLLIENGYVEALADSPGSARGIVLLLSAVLAVAALSRCRSLPGDSEGVTVAFSLACVTMLLLSPISWIHICIILLLPILFFLRVAESDGRPSLRWWGLGALLLFSLPDVAVANRLAAFFLPERVPATAFLLTRTASWGLCALWLLLWSYRPVPPPRGGGSGQKIPYSM